MKRNIALELDRTYRELMAYRTVHATNRDTLMLADERMTTAALLGATKPHDSGCVATRSRKSGWLF